MGGGKRSLQIGEIIRRNFGTVLQAEGSYIYGTQPFVTVTNVQISPDLSIAKIYLSVYNVDDKQTVILEMEREHQRLKNALAYRVRKHVRKMPEINFYLDDTLDEMQRLNQLFDKIEDKKEDEEA